MDKWIGKTVNLVNDEEIFEYDLEDMLGRCYLERIKHFSKEEILDDKIDNIIMNVDNAIFHFSNTIWYGSASYGIPGKLESIWRGIEIIKVWKGWGEECLIEKLYKDEKTRKYLEMGNELIREVDEYDMSTLGHVRMLEEKEHFEKVCSPLEPSMLIQNLENLRVKLDSKDYVSQYAVSSGMINGYERKYSTKSNEYRRSQLLYNALHGNADAQEDSEKVFMHLDLLVKLGNSHEVSYTTYKYWFEYAKYREVSLVRAWDVALQWKNQELSRVRENSLYESNLLRPYYYLFIIALLRYLTNQGMTEKDVSERKNDLNKQIRGTSRNTSAVQDWFASGKGMGQLYDRSWIGLSDVDSESRIRVVKGRVIYYDERNWGYMRLSNPRALSSWGKAPIGQRYSKDSDIFFDVRQSSVISEVDVGNGQEKEFKVGFSYERMVASTKSLERNIKKSSIVETVSKPKMDINTIVPFFSDDKSGKKLVRFTPKKYMNTKSGISFLNGVLDNGCRAGLSSDDVSKYSEALCKYGSADNIIQMLHRLKEFNVCIIAASRDSLGNNVVKVSLYETGADLERLLQHIPLEKRLLSENCDITRKVLFSPKTLVQSYPNSYLNGFLSNGMRGGLGTQDIEKYESKDIRKYGDSLDVLQKLQQMENFEVIIECYKNPQKCHLSLYRTGKSLSEVLVKMSKETVETHESSLEKNKIESVSDNQIVKKVLPILKKDTELFLFNYEIRGKQISGFVRIDGYEEPFPAVIPSVPHKLLNALKNKKEIPVRFVSKNEDRYILKLK